MKILPLCTLTLLSLGLSFGPQVPSEARAHMIATTADSGVLTGELVVTNGARNQFRLIGHTGWFTAPPGTSAQALGGKPVQAVFSRDGRVLEISAMPIHIEPIAHGYEIVSGQLELLHDSSRAFTLAGGDRTYLAPSVFDIRRYAGRRVEVLLDEKGRVADIGLARSGGVRVASTCMFGGAAVLNGSSICRDGTTFRCAQGAWVNVGAECS